MTINAAAIKQSTWTGTAINFGVGLGTGIIATTLFSNPVGWTAIGVSGFIGGFSGSTAQQAYDYENVNFKEAAKDGLLGAIGGGVTKFGVNKLLSIKGGLNFKDFKVARGGTETLALIQTTNKAGKPVLQRISTEYHHMFITQRFQKAYNIPNWLVNNRLNFWKMNTVQHSLLDKPEVGQILASTQ